MNDDWQINRRKLLAAIGTTGSAALLFQALHGGGGGFGGVVQAVYGGGGGAGLEKHIGVDSIEALREVDRTKATKAYAAGYYIPGDGGGGLYALDAGDAASPDNGGTVIVASDGGRWKLCATGIVSVKQFGAKGNGTSDDGANIQAAVSALGGKRLFFPKGAYIAASITIASSIDWVGEGPESVIRQKELSNRNFIQVGGIGTQVSLFDLTIDQNSQQQTYGQGKFALNCTAVGQGISRPAILHTERVHMTNTCEGAIRFLGDRTETNREMLRVVRCRFTNGSESRSSPAYNTFTLYIADAATAAIEGCHFEHTPSESGEGIPAISVAGTNVSSVEYSKLSITDNYFSGYGRFTNGSGIGVIDLYIWSRNVVLTGNRLENSHVAPIRGKVNADNLVVSGNVIHGVTQHIPSSASGISLVPATVGPVAGRYVITDNIVKGSGFRGIEITGTADNKPELVEVSGNMIDTAADIGIYVGNVKHFTIANNMISDTGGSGITYALCEGNGKIADNLIKAAGSTGIGYVGVQKSLCLSIAGNMIESPASQGIAAENIGELLLHGNIVKNVASVNGTQRAFRIGGTSAVDIASVKNNVVSGTVASGPVTYTGAGVTALQEEGNSWNGAVKYGSAAPTTGTYAQGDIVYNTTPVPGGGIGWVCTSAGSPGAWKAFGTIEE
ncbi:hypothetical protein FE784_40075 [Paenibacillus hemerocallicola]|uniref:Pectate lyase superfamily protein domain-containing protein n=1 Tax=Paenibacillus hemerocallicola TaxID=1172614 RepID=A0A5C4SUX0_9BACL|nr:right-handed parallel beta-helix repeat-containing protein [Paenibacillus hemerocallicola]TNJ54137.1 hypothetical protein FE784_40075 [Paenibacillus hemerocallicola]